MNLAELKTSKYFKRDPSITFEDHQIERYWQHPDVVIEISIDSFNRAFLSHIEVDEENNVTYTTTDDRYLQFNEDDDVILHIYTLNAMI